MKSMRLDKMKRFVFLVFFLLSGCSAIISLYPSYTQDIMHGERFWVKKGTKEQVSEDIYTDCYNDGVRADLRQKNLPPDASGWDWYNVALYQGKCLHDLGYVFKEDILSKYCYHYINEVDCRAYRKFKY
ncbi:hypothetical protein BTV20_02310 [Histophilus somni]|nr:hypothetical protein BTV18_02310 [Histophilus somni]ARU66205.1 hypothetical protein BTV19_02305 [Histophilus somni]ARU68078.1 hypothetical protein BTV16_02310 [Histophilus somni]ARU69959.1 hypothetical protein BTV20_02310 [Histophilus somni]ARU71834.1 hypothetical protein BTV17_02305 [Histophilus somni]